MSRVEQLIMELSPDGVSSQPLSELASYVRGVTYRKNDEQEKGLLRVLRSNNINLASNTLNLDNVRLVSSNVRVRDDQRLYADDILMSAASGSKAHVGKVAYIWEDLPETVFGGFMAVLRVNGSVEPRFLFHLLIGRSFSEHLSRTLSTTTINNLNASIVGSFIVPVPPLEVQREIVRVLDDFTLLETELEAELGAELKARQQQYRHYRREVMAGWSDVDWTTLGDATTNYDRRRKPVTRSDRKEGIYPYYGANGIQDYVDEFLFDGTFLLLGEDGSVKEPDGSPVLNWATGRFWVNNHAHVLTSSSEDFNLRFLFHYLKTVDISAYVSGGTQPKLNQKNLNQIPVPRIARNEQDRVVVLFDEFESFLNDLGVVLSAELVARRKQYEYYRDRLLTFEEVAA